MLRLAAGVSYCDLQFQSRPRIVAAALLHGAGGAAIVDPGPSSTLPTLHAALAASGLSMRDVTALLLTHIHLDHAGATGTLVRENPGLRVYVHERGAPHLVDPCEAGRERHAAVRRRDGAVVGRGPPRAGVGPDGAQRRRAD